MAKGYRLYNLKISKMIITRDVISDEDATQNWEQQKIEKHSTLITDVPIELAQDGGTDEERPPSPSALSSSG